MPPAFEIQAIAAVTAAACAVPGCFLLLRRMSMLTDAISHAILPGIVLGYLLVGNLGSPLLILGAALAGVLTVWLVELLYQSGNLREDAAIGIVFPAMFALGVLMIARFAQHVHLDIDAVLMGELAFAPFDRLVMGGQDLGPRALVAGSVMLLVNLLFVTATYKELKLFTFDEQVATVLGFAPVLLYYLFMTLVSATAVVAFDTVGSVLVVALFIGPPAMAYLLTDRLDRMLVYAAVLGVACALIGYQFARIWDVSIAGMIATVVGVGFGLVAMLSPRTGMIAAAMRRRRQRQDRRTTLLVVHLLNHQRGGAQGMHGEECRLSVLPQHLTWSEPDTDAVVRQAKRRGLIEVTGDDLRLTQKGTQAAESALTGTGHMVT